MQNGTSATTGALWRLEVTGPRCDIVKFGEQLKLATMREDPVCACIFNEPSTDVITPDSNAEGLSHGDKREVIKQADKVAEAKTKTCGKILTALSEASFDKLKAHPGYKDVTFDPFALWALVREVHKDTEVVKQTKGLHAGLALHNLKMTPGKFEQHYVEFSRLHANLARFDKPLEKGALAKLYLASLDKASRAVIQARCNGSDFVKVIASMESIYEHVKAGLSVAEFIHAADGNGHASEEQPDSRSEHALAAHQLHRSKGNKCGIADCPFCGLCTAIHSAEAKHCYHDCRKLKQVTEELMAQGRSVIERKPPGSHARFGNKRAAATNTHDKRATSGAGYVASEMHKSRKPDEPDDQSWILFEVANQDADHTRASVAEDKDGASKESARVYPVTVNPIHGQTDFSGASNIVKSKDDIVSHSTQLKNGDSSGSANSLDNGRRQVGTNMHGVLVHAGAASGHLQPQGFTMAISPVSDILVYDTACTSHMTNNANSLTNLTEEGMPRLFKGLGGIRKLSLRGMHPVCGLMFVCKELPFALVSHCQLIQDGWNVKMVGNECTCTHGPSGRVMQFKSSPDMHGLLSLKLDRITEEAFAADLILTDKQRKRGGEAMTLHRLLAHIPDSSLIILLDSNQILGTDLNGGDVRTGRSIEGMCNSCSMGKTRHDPANPSNRLPIATGPWQVIHGDLNEVTGKNAKFHYLIVVCEFSKYLLPVKLDGKGAEALQKGLDEVLAHGAQYAWQTKTLRTDHEHVLVSVKTHANSKGVQLMTSPPGRHERLIERSIQTLKGCMRAIKAGLPYRLPAVAHRYLLEHACNMLNRVPHPTNPNLTPLYIVASRKTQLEELFEFGKLVLTKNPGRGEGTKPVSELAILLRQDPTNVRAATVLLIHANQIADRHQFVEATVTVDVVAAVNRLSGTGPEPDEEILWSRSRSTETELVPVTGEATAAHEDESTEPSTSPGASSATTEVSGEHRSSHATAAGNLNTSSSPPGLDTARSAHIAGSPESSSPAAAAPDHLPAELPNLSRTKPQNVAVVAGNPPNPYARLYTTNRRAALVPPGVTMLSVEEPGFAMLTYNQVREHYPEETERALEDELRQLFESGAVQPRHSADLSATHRKNTLRAQAVFQVKHDPNTGIMIKVKSRICADGAGQDPGSYAAISSTTVEPTSIFMVLAVAAQRRWHIAAFDVKAAYLHADLGEGEPVCIRFSRQLAQAYVKLYPGANSFIGYDGSMILELHKALYGLKQSALLFYQLLASNLIEMGMKISVFDRSVAYKDNLMAGLHVDDILTIGEKERDLRRFEVDLNGKFRAGVTSHYGDEIKYLGMVIRQSPDRSSFAVSQPKYIEDLLQQADKFRVEDAEEDNPGATAALPHTEDMFQPSSGELVNSASYLSRAGMIMYLATRTRPDLLTIAGVLMQRSRAPKRSDLQMLRRVESYIRGTKDYVRVIDPKSLVVDACVDASYAVHPDYKSHTGFMLRVGGSVVHANSTKQKLVTTSSTQSELAALSSVVDRIVWARNWMLEKGIAQPVTRVLQDNQSTMRLAEQGYGTARETRHWNVRYFYVKQAIDTKEITLTYSKSEDMPADALTKPVPRAVFEKFIQTLGLKVLPAQAKKASRGRLASESRGVLEISAGKSSRTGS